MPFCETSYGNQKRLQFLKYVIEKSRPNRVLDIGCGIGTHITFPLAKYFPNISFLGVDSDPCSIECARNENTVTNLAFAHPQELEQDGIFDLIVASEVIEHVEQPEQFLLFLREKMTDEGKLILTLPNGYGPFEIMSLVENLRCTSRLCDILRKMKRRPTDDLKDPRKRDTLAISPHVNFFSYAQIYKLIVGSGFTVSEYRPRTLLCGFVWDKLLRGQFMLRWNARVADSLPPSFSSGWMFVLEKGKLCEDAGYRRGIYARFHRYVNEKR